jgi:hypothetical protein
MVAVVVKTEQLPQASSCVFKRRTVVVIYIMSSVGKMALNSLPRRSSVKRSGKGEKNDLQSGSSSLQLPSCSCSHLVTPSLTLLIQFVERVSEIDCTSRQQQKKCGL